jgi:hypothetical protein
MPQWQQGKGSAAACGASGRVGWRGGRPAGCQPLGAGVQPEAAVLRAGEQVHLCVLPMAAQQVVGGGQDPGGMVGVKGAREMLVYMCRVSNGSWAGLKVPVIGLSVSSVN